jgi:phenylpropionate dioxygenase-like ring-hydroxylating dioxygenase large terminal subunit
MLLRNAWYIAAWADEIGGEPLARRICDEPIVLFRDKAGQVAALADRCVIARRRCIGAPSSRRGFSAVITG